MDSSRNSLFCHRLISRLSPALKELREVSHPPTHSLIRRRTIIALYAALLSAQHLSLSLSLTHTHTHSHTHTLARVKCYSNRISCTYIFVI
jgi:hypothetical protein